jgi:hypothetical protein
MALYPPQIAGTIPALQKGKDLVVPFVMNKTVSWNEIKGFIIKIKSIQNNEVLTTARVTNSNGYNKQKHEVYFSIKTDKLTIG